MQSPMAAYVVIGEGLSSAEPGDGDRLPESEPRKEAESCACLMGNL